MKLSKLIEDLPQARLVGSTDVDVTSVVEDSRECTAGCLYVARSGAVTDGRKFIPAAVQAGAAAVVLSGSNRVMEGACLH